MMDFQDTQEHIWSFAGKLCDEVREFQPEVVLALMHSGWLPLFAGRELWNQVESRPFPPVVRTNLGREKIDIFNETVKNPHGLSNRFLGDFDTEPSIAFFLAWVAGRTDWQAELKAQIQAQIGEKTPERILIVDEFVHESSTFLLTQGLLNRLYPRAQTRFLNASLEWTGEFWKAWAQENQPQLLETELFGPPLPDEDYPPLWQTGRQLVKGSEDLSPDSLGWRKITAESQLLESLSPFLPAETWLTAPGWVERVVQNEMVRRAGEYVPGSVPSRKRHTGGLLKSFLLRDLLMLGKLSVQQVSQAFGFSSHRARRELLRLTDDGLLLASKAGGEKIYLASPRLLPGYWAQPRPLLNCYWAAPGRLLVGEFPGWDQDESLLPRLDWLLENGVTFCLDLSHDYGRRPKEYHSLFETKAAEKGQALTCHAIFTPRHNLPTRFRILEILEVIDTALANGQVVYLHGLHRGGIEHVIAGCWLVRHGLTGKQALETLHQARKNTFDAWRSAPGSERARSFVRRWHE